MRPLRPRRGVRCHPEGTASHAQTVEGAYPVRITVHLDQRGTVLRMVVHFSKKLRGLCEASEANLVLSKFLRWPSAANNGYRSSIHE